MSQVLPDSLDLHKATTSAAKATAAKKGESQLDTNLDKLSDPKSAPSSPTEQNKSTDLDATGSSSAKPRADKITSDTARILSLLPTLKKSEGDFGAAVESFKKTLARSWHGSSQLERGDVFILGTVEVIGSLKRIKFDLIATHKPGTTKVSVHALMPKPAIAKRLVPRG